MIMSKWSRKNGEEEINLRHLMDKSAEAGELNLWNRERGTTNIFHSVKVTYHTDFCLLTHSKIPGINPTWS